MDRFEDIYSNTPPAPPPKPGSHEVSRINTPTATQSPRPAPPVPDHQQQHSDLPEATGLTAAQQAQVARPQDIPDPGDQWLPRFLEDKSCVFLSLSPAIRNTIHTYNTHTHTHTSTNTDTSTYLTAAAH